MKFELAESPRLESNFADRRILRAEPLLGLARYLLRRLLHGLALVVRGIWRLPCT